MVYGKPKLLASDGQSVGLRSKILIDRVANGFQCNRGAIVFFPMYRLCRLALACDLPLRSDGYGELTRGFS